MEARPVEVHRLKRARPLELSITRLRQVQKPSVRGYEHQKLVSVWVALELTSTRELVPGDPEFLALRLDEIRRKLSSLF